MQLLWFHHIHSTELTDFNATAYPEVWWSVWCYDRVWSGVGTPKAELEGRIHRCSYATPHEVITSYRSPDFRWVCYNITWVRSCIEISQFSTVWSGAGTPKADLEGRSHMCSYATPHDVITSYRLPDKCCLVFISYCFKYQVDTKLCISLL